MVKRVMCLAVLAGGSVTLAAETKTCDDFAAAFKKAGKVSGKEVSDDDLTFWKGLCAKKVEADIKQTTECFNKAAKPAAVEACMKAMK